MWLELFLGGSVSVIGGSLWYVYQHHKKQQAQRLHDEREAQQAFRSTLLHTLNKVSISTFNFSRFVDESGLPRPLADKAVDELYLEVLANVLADGVITEVERKKLGALSKSLEISEERALEFEQRVKDKVYTAVVREALTDGTISDEEHSQLVSLRRSLGIDKTRAFQLTEQMNRESYTDLVRRCLRDGLISPEEREALDRCRDALALSSEEAERIIQAEAIKVFREVFISVIQDGDVTLDEEKRLIWLHKQTGLSDFELKPYRESLDEVKRLSSFRKGTLPSIQTRKILENGEICHWEGECKLIYRTEKTEKTVEGMLTVTSKKIYYSSPSKSFSFAPGKVLDIGVVGDSLNLQINARQGTGIYHLDYPQGVEAILCGLVRKHKLLVVENFSSAKSRHIPPDVKQAVWQRDSGRCVYCGASEYLEFDHQIPHSLGGANSVRNIQLLCRRCNSRKRDRVG